MLTTIEEYLSNFLPNLVPDPAAMKERQTIADVDDCLQDDLIWDWQVPSAPAAL
jgi:hypothetical protein